MPLLKKSENIATYRKEKIKDGDYVYAPDNLMEGVYFRGGVIIDFKQEDRLEKEFCEEWRDDSIANSSVVKLRKIAGTTFLTKGILQDIGMHLKQNPEINVVFINSTMTSLQIKKLQKRWNDFLCDREDRVRRYNLKSVEKEMYSPTDIDSESEASGTEMTQEQLMARTIRVVDRFGVIL